MGARLSFIAGFFPGFVGNLAVANHRKNFAVFSCGSILPLLLALIPLPPVQSPPRALVSASPPLSLPDLPSLLLELLHQLIDPLSSWFRYRLLFAPLFCELLGQSGTIKSHRRLGAETLAVFCRHLVISPTL